MKAAGRGGRMTMFIQWIRGPDIASSNPCFSRKLLPHPLSLDLRVVDSVSSPFRSRQTPEVLCTDGVCT